MWLNEGFYKKKMSPFTRRKARSLKLKRFFPDEGDRSVTMHPTRVNAYIACQVNGVVLSVGHHPETRKSILECTRASHIQRLFIVYMDGA